MSSRHHRLLPPLPPLCVMRPRRRDDGARPPAPKSRASRPTYKTSAKKKTLAAPSRPVRKHVQFVSDENERTEERKKKKPGANVLDFLATPLVSIVYTLYSVAAFVRRLLAHYAYNIRTDRKTGI